MDILRKYRHFINEAVDSDKEIRTLNDVPSEVIESAKKIAGDMFDRVRKPVFELSPEGLIMKFQVTQQDFNYIDENETLKLDMTEGARKKRTYDVTLSYLDRISETFEVTYLVNFEIFEFVPEDDEDEIVEDDIEDEIEYDDVDDAIMTKYQELLSKWKKEQIKNNANTNPGEGTRRRLMDQAKKELSEDEEYFDEDVADQNIKKGKIKIQDVEDLEELEDEDE